MTPYPSRELEHSVVVQPTGRVNMVAAPRLRDQLRELVENGSRNLVVDLSATEFIDSSGLGALISGLKAARQAGGDLRIAAPSEQVRRVLTLTRLDTVLTAHATPEAAFDGR